MNKWCHYCGRFCNHSTAEHFCLNCHSRPRRKKFCSQQCAAHYSYRTTNPVRLVQFKCKCGRQQTRKATSEPPKYCSAKCRSLFQGRSYRPRHRQKIRQINSRAITKAARIMSDYYIRLVLRRHNPVVTDAMVAEARERISRHRLKRSCRNAQRTMQILNSIQEIQIQ
jgi:hypothetical protein